MCADIKCSFMRKVHLTPLKPKHTFSDKISASYSLQEDTRSVILTYRSSIATHGRHIILHIKSFVNHGTYIQIYGDNVETDMDVCISLSGDARILKRLLSRFNEHPNICRGMPHLDEYGNMCYYVDEHCIDAGAVYAQLDRKLNNGVHTNWWHV